MGRIDKLTYKNGNDVLLSLDYALNKGSQIVGIDEVTQNGNAHFDFSYDSGGQLTSVKKDNATLGEYEYDATGNRTSVDGKGAIYDSSDRIESLGTRVYSTDASGFVTGKAEKRPRWYMRDQA